jgi:hypothetical protein
MFRAARILVPLFATLLCLAPSAAEAQKVTVSGTVTGGDGYQIFLLTKSGTSTTADLSGRGAFRLRVAKSKLKGASLHLAKDGQYWGPITVAQKLSARTAATTLSGKLLSGSKNLNLGKLTLVTADRFARVNRSLKATLRQTLRTLTNENGKPLGAGSLGVVESNQTAAFGISAAAVESGEDADRDGLPAALDADDDGDLVLDGADPDSAGGDVPYTTLFLDFRRTLNAHVRAGLTDEVIDNIVSGENAFSFFLFLSQPPNSTATGGHVICDDALTYCRRNSPLGFFGGVSESGEEFRGKPWSELLTAAGFPRLENANLGGGSAILASVQPRVSRSVFRAGDIIRAVLTNSSGAEVSSTTFTVAPYFVSVPALQSYTTANGTVTVDYSAVSSDSGSIPGTSPGDPIVLGSDGLLTVTFWRPQRQAIRSDENPFLDIGGLNYGLSIGSLQASCGGLYSAVSSDLIADETPLGNGNSPLANTGANLTPYRDSQLDRAVAVENTLTFTVDLKTCLSRAGGSPGTYDIPLFASGESVTGGQPSAAQTMYVSIP